MALALVGLLAGAGAPAMLAQTTFSGGGSISVIVTGSASVTGSSTLPVSGVSGTVQTISVTLKGLTSNGNNTGANTNFSVGCTSFALSGPGGQKLVLLGSTGDGEDGDSANPSDSGSGINGLNITIQDGSPAAPNVNGSWPHSGSTTVEPSSYWLDLNNGFCSNSTLPSDLTTFSFPQTDGVARGGSNATLNGLFGGSNPDGTWTLSIIDEGGEDPDPVSISSWSLTMTFSGGTVDSTSTSVSSNTSNPASTANSITLTATVADTTNPGTTVDAGTVAFTANGTTISGCGAAPVSGGTATCNTTFSTQGLYAIVASYTPGSGFSSSASGTFNQVVEHPTTEPTADTWCNTGAVTIPGGSEGLAYPSVIKVSGYPAGTTVANVEVELEGVTGIVYAQHLLVAPDGHNLDFFDAGFNPADTASAPGVNLNFYDGASGGYPDYPSGTDAPASGNYLPSDEATGTESFPASSANSYDTSIPAIPATVNYGYDPFNTSAHGSVGETFESNFNGAPANGTWALYPYTALAYPETMNGGWCIALTLNTGSPTTTALASSQNPQTTTQATTFTATVTSGGSPVPSGTVTFTDNDQVPAGVTNNTVALNGNGQASITTSSLAEGDHLITASYSGTDVYDLSFATLTQRMNDATQVYAANAAIPNGGTCSASYCYCNPGAVTSNSAYKGAFTPDPSVISVTNLPGTIQSVSLGLNQFSSATDILYALESMVVGPTGADLDFFSNAGWNGGIGGTASLGNYLFSDSASGQVPQSVTTLSPGSYQPSSYPEGDPNWPEPAQPYTASSSGFYTLPSTITYAASQGAGTFASQFVNTNPSTNPNGVWALYMTEDDAAGTAGAANGWCVNFTENTVTVAPTLGHSGSSGAGSSFVPNEQNAQITASILNNGSGPTGDPVSGSNPLTVVDTLPIGLTFAAGSNGADWTCSASGQTVTCTNDESIAQGSSYPDLTIDVNVASNATGPLANAITVSGAGASNASANDSIPVVPPPSLAVTKTHTGTFTQGQTAEWEITVSNTAANTSTTSGAVTVQDTLPSGYLLYNYSGVGWSCSGTGTVTCTSSQTVSGGSSFATLTLIVDVPVNSPASVSNTAGAWGGGDPNHTSSANAATGTDSNVPVVQVPASVAVVAGNNQSATVGTAFASPLTVLVKDGGGNADSGATVAFTAPGSGASATLSNAGSCTTGANGECSVTATANTIAGGPYTVSAQSGTVSTGFSLTNTASAAATTTTLTSGNLTLPWSANQQSITMTASVTSPAGVVNEGTMTFDTYVPKVVSGVTTYVAVPVAVLVSAGSASYTYLLPAGLTVGTYSLLASYSDSSGVFLSSSDTTHTLTITTPNFVVNTAADDATGTASNCTGSPEGTCTLRDALAAAASAGGANITFASSAFGSGATITLTNGTLNVPSNTIIQGLTSGSGATLTNLVTVSGNNAATVFTVAPIAFANPVVNVEIANLNIVDGNGTSGTSQGGGAYVGDGSSLTVIHCTISSNTAPEGGGLNNLNILTVEDSTISGNTATNGSIGVGGGIYSDAAARSLTVIDSTISGNLATGTGAALGGGIFSGSPATITGSTIAANLESGGSGTSFAGGGILYSSTLTLKNTIVAGNEASGSYADLDNFQSAGTLTDGGGNLLGTSISGASQVAAGLASLGNYGGATQTMLPEPGSPAICAGSLSLVPSGTTTDQRGVAFNAGGYCPTGTVDAGAVQTDYAMSFTAPVSNVAADTAMSPAPAVTLDEDGTAFTAAAATIPLTLTSSPAGATLTGGSASTSAGVATYSSLTVNQPGTGDQLTASLTLNTSPAVSISAQSGTFNVSQITPTLSFAPAPGSQTYGAAIAAGSLDATATYNSGNVAGTFAYTTTVNGSPVTLVAGTTVLPAGNYTITATFTPSNPSVDTSASTTAPYTVSQAALTITASSGTMIYGGTAPTITPSYAGFVNGDSAASLTAQPACSTTATSKSAVGSYPSTCAGAADANYTISYTPGSVTVGKAALTITASSGTMIYGGTAPTITPSYAGFVNSDSAASLTVQPTCSTTATSKSAVGSYPSTCAGAADANYTISYTPGSVTVGKAALTITANNATKVYGTANPTFTGTVSGQQAGDTFTEGFSTTAALSSPVGTYSIIPSVSGADLADYTQTVTNGTLTVTQAASTIALKVNSGSITPGESVMLTATVISTTTGTPTGTVNFYDNGTLLNAAPVALTAGVASYAATALAPGLTHTLTAVYSGDANFTASSTTAGVPVIVAPLDFTMTINGPSFATVIPGSAITYQVWVSPDYGAYSGTVNFAVSGLPPGATVSFSPASIPANGGPQIITVTIQTAPATAALQRPQPPPTGRRDAAPLALAALMLFGLGGLRKSRRALQRFFCLMVLLTAGAMATLSLTGCAGGFFNQAPKNYTVTITATSGNLEHSALVTLNLQ